MYDIKNIYVQISSFEEFTNCISLLEKCGCDGTRIRNCVNNNTYLDFPYIGIHNHSMMIDGWPLSYGRHPMKDVIKYKDFIKSFKFKKHHIPKWKEFWKNS